MLQKGVYHYEQMKVLVKFNKTSLPEKEVFYVHLNFEDITDADYVLVKRVCKDFEILVTTERRRNYLESEPIYHPTKFFTEILLAIEIRKMKYLWINLPIYDFQY